MTTVFTVGNGVAAGEHVNGVDEVSMEDRFFEDISEPPSEDLSTRHLEVKSVREEDIPTLRVGDFTQDERTHLEQVLNRYYESYQFEGERQQQLKSDLDSVAVKDSDDSNNNSKRCHCCGEELNFLLNRGRPCAQCQSSVCGKCLKQFRDGVTKICQFCYLENMHEGRSGKWFMMNLQKSGRSPIFGTEVLRASLKRHDVAEEEQRQREAEIQLALEREAAIHTEAESQLNGYSRKSSKSENRSVASAMSAAQLMAGKKWKFGKKNKKNSGSDGTDSDGASTTGLSLSSQQPVIEVETEEIIEEEDAMTLAELARSGHEDVRERSVDMVDRVDEAAHRAVRRPPSIPESDVASSLSHSIPPPSAIEIEEGSTTMSDPTELATLHSASAVPSIVLESTADEEVAWRDRKYVSEENHIFPEDDPETDLSHLRAPSHSHTMSQESVLSIYSDTSAGYRLAVDVTGEVAIGMDYDFKHSIFFVKIKQCRDIAAVDTKRKKSDPYVKTYLLPDKTKVSKRKTSYRKNTLNPVFDEQLKYVISKSELETRVLSVAIWHRVAFGHNIFLGEAHIPMEDYEFGDPTAKWYPLNEKRDIAIPMPLMMYRGDLILAVKYVPGNEGNGEVQAWIKEAKNLVAARANGYSDPFCKGYLLPDKSRNGKKKTRVIKRNLNPAWNSVLRFTDIEEENLPDRSLELTIWDYGRFSTNEFLGGLRLNLGIGVYQGQHVKWMDSKGHEITMWQAMISRPNSWIEGTLMLRPNMD